MAEKPGTERPCARCKMRIVFLEGQSGPERPIPAQRVRTAYRRIPGDRAEKIDLPGALFAVDEFVYINHFETCPYASSFSRSGNRAPDAPER